MAAARKQIEQKDKEEFTTNGDKGITTLKV